MIILAYLFTPVFFYATVMFLFIFSLITLRAVTRRQPATLRRRTERPVNQPQCAAQAETCEAKLLPAAPKSPEEKKDQHAQLKTILRKLHRRHQEKPLGDILIEQKFITLQQLDEALRLQKEEKKEMLLGEILVAMSLVTEEQVMTAIMIQYHLHYIPLENYTLKQEIIDVIPAQVAWKYLVIPIEKVMQSLTVAMFNPLNKAALTEIETASKCSVIPCLAKPSELRKLVKEYYVSG